MNKNDSGKDAGKKPKVAINVVNWNSGDDVIECIKSLKETDYPDYKIIVNDNASSDGSPEKIAELYPDVVLLRNKVNLGYGAAANRGMKYALDNGFDYIFLYSQDAVLEPNVIGKLIEEAEKKPNIGLFGPLIYFYNVRDKLQYCGSELDWDQFTSRKIKDLNELKIVPKDNFWLWTTAALMKCSVLKDVGFFNEDFFAYCEDFELSLEVSKKGYDVEILQSVKIYHKSNSTDEGGRENVPIYQCFYITRNKYWLWKKYTKGFKRVRLLRLYCAQIVNEIAHCKASGYNEAIDAYLDGLYCALKGIRGEWDKSIKMPCYIKRLILAAPFFWTDLLRGKFGKIFTSVFKRMGFKLKFDN